MVGMQERVECVRGKFQKAVFLSHRYFYPEEPPVKELILKEASSTENLTCWCFAFFSFLFKHLIEMELDYSVVLVSVHSIEIQLCMYTYSFFFRFFSHIGHYEVLGRVPRATQEALVDYLFYITCAC